MFQSIRDRCRLPRRKPGVAEDELRSAYRELLGVLQARGNAPALRRLARMAEADGVGTLEEARTEAASFEQFLKDRGLKQVLRQGDALVGEFDVAAEHAIRGRMRDAGAREVHLRDGDLHAVAATDAGHR